jgi:hypothetical protein
MLGFHNPLTLVSPFVVDICKTANNDYDNLQIKLARMHNRSWEEDVQICSQLIHQEEEMKEIWTNFLLKNQQNKFQNICFTGLGLCRGFKVGRYPVLLPGVLEEKNFRSQPI